MATINAVTPPGFGVSWTTAPDDGISVKAAHIRQLAESCFTNDLWLKKLLKDASGSLNVGELTALSVLTGELHATGDGFIDGILSVGSSLGVSGGGTFGGTLIAPAFQYPSIHSTTRASWQLVWVDFDGSFDLDTYVPWARMFPNGTTGIPTLKTRSITTTEHTAAGGIDAFVELLDPVPGWTLKKVEVASRGTGTADVDGDSEYEVFKWNGQAVPSSISSVTSDAHTSGNWTTAQITTVTLSSGGVVIDPAYRYGVKIRFPYDSLGTGMEYSGFKAFYEGQALTP